MQTFAGAAQHSLLAGGGGLALIDYEEDKAGDHNQRADRRGQPEQPGKEGGKATRHGSRVDADRCNRPVADECIREREASTAQTRARLIAALRKEALIIGDVTLASGRRASYYVDVRRAVLLPEVFAEIGVLLGQIATELHASAVGGVPVGAIPVACAALGAAAAGYPTTLERAFIIRGERKQHGLRRSIEGPQLGRGERCLLVEDVVTTGGSTVRVLEQLAGEEIEIAGVVCVLDRLAGGGEAIAAATDAPFRALTTIDEVYPERPDR